MSLFQDTGFDLLPKIPFPQALPEIQRVIVPPPLSTLSATPGTPGEPGGPPEPGKGNWIGSALLMVLLIASVAGVLYIAKKYARPAVAEKKQGL